jgi:hypothetical protein
VVAPTAAVVKTKQRNKKKLRARTTIATLWGGSRWPTMLAKHFIYQVKQEINLFGRGVKCGPKKEIASTRTITKARCGLPESSAPYS